MDHYKNLLLKEERISTEIAISKITIEENIKTYLSPKNLFGFFEDKLDGKVNQDFSGEFELKKYLISLSLDFLYEKVSSSLLSSSDEKINTVDWRIVAKSIVDRFYVNNKPYITNIVSIYVDKGIKKWTK
jgi:hypothetical protein